MRRLRTQWLALFGALVILSLSLSSAFGARPPTGTSQAAGIGQQVATFVHVLLSGTNDEDEGGDEDQDEDQDEDSGDSDECQPAADEDGASNGDESGSTNEEAGEETGDEAGDEDQDCDEQSNEDSDGDSDQDSDEDSGEEDSGHAIAQNHGQCVAEVAHSDAVGENGTHGWAVALAAQVTCWPDLNGDEDAGSGADEASAAPVKSHGKSEAAHQRKLDRGHGKPAWASAKTHGGGHGKGHGKRHNG